jgi:hypothetical protein
MKLKPKRKRKGKEEIETDGTKKRKAGIHPSLNLFSTGGQ